MSKREIDHLELSLLYYCLAVLALVASCYCRGTTTLRRNQNQKPCDSSAQNDESNQQPCDLIQQQNSHQNKKKNIQVQDSSSGSDELQNQRKVNIHISQEDNRSKEILHAPEHERAQRNQKYSLQKQRTRHNEQKSRHENNEIESNENTSQVGKNQLRGH